MALANGTDACEWNPSTEAAKARRGAKENRKTEILPAINANAREWGKNAKDFLPLFLFAGIRVIRG